MVGGKGPVMGVKITFCSGYAPVLVTRILKMNDASEIEMNGPHGNSIPGKKLTPWLVLISKRQPIEIGITGMIFVSAEATNWFVPEEPIAVAVATTTFVSDAHRV